MVNIIFVIPLLLLSDNNGSANVYFFFSVNVRGNDRKKWFTCRISFFNITARRRYVFGSVLISDILQHSIFDYNITTTQTTLADAPCLRILSKNREWGSTPLANHWQKQKFSRTPMATQWISWSQFETSVGKQIYEAFERIMRKLGAILARNTNRVAQMLNASHFHLVLGSRLLIVAAILPQFGIFSLKSRTHDAF